MACARAVSRHPMRLFGLSRPIERRSFRRRPRASNSLAGAVAGLTISRPAECREIAAAWAGVRSHA